MYVYIYIYIYYKIQYFIILFVYWSLNLKNALKPSPTSLFIKVLKYYPQFFLFYFLRILTSPPFFISVALSILILFVY